MCEEGGRKKTPGAEVGGRQGGRIAGRHYISEQIERLDFLGLGEKK